MNTDITSYKNNRISELNVIYKQEYMTIVNNSNSSIYNVNKSKPLNRVQLINNIIVKYKNDTTLLNNQFKMELLTIQQFVAEQIPIIKNKKALLVGINYINTQDELNGCINDVNVMSNKLRIDYGFKSITILTDETAYKPTRNNIIKEICCFFITVVMGRMYLIEIKMNVMDTMR